jgi:D-arabinose 1-dehydrogenase-like Zn-dependent alcohol dehydrogenase
MHIICDMLRGPVFSAGFGAAAREGVIVSAGWQLERFVEYNSASASIKEITLDHTHLETIAGIHAATELYGRVFKPTVHEDIYEFEDLPRALAEMHQNVQTGIPIIRVAKEMPEVVAKLID